MSTLLFLDILARQSTAAQQYTHIINHGKASFHKHLRCNRQQTHIWKCHGSSIYLIYDIKYSFSFWTFFRKFEPLPHIFAGLPATEHNPMLACKYEISILKLARWYKHNNGHYFTNILFRYGAAERKLNGQCMRNDQPSYKYIYYI